VTKSAWISRLYRTMHRSGPPRDEEGVPRRPISDVGLSWGVVFERFHDREVRGPPRRSIARHRHEEDAEAGNGRDRGRRQDDEFVLRGRGGSKETDEGEEQATQADARRQADECGDDTSEGRLQQEEA